MSGMLDQQRLADANGVAQVPRPEVRGAQRRHRQGGGQGLVVGGMGVESGQPDRLGRLLCPTRHPRGPPAKPLSPRDPEVVSARLEYGERFVSAGFPAYPIKGSDVQLRQAHHQTGESLPTWVLGGGQPTGDMHGLSRPSRVVQHPGKADECLQEVLVSSGQEVDRTFEQSGGSSPIASCAGALRCCEEPRAGARTQGVEARVLGVEVGEVSVGLLEVVADDFLDLDKATSGLQPGGEALVELGADLFGQGVVCRIADRAGAGTGRLLLPRRAGPARAGSAPCGSTTAAAWARRAGSKLGC